MSSSAASKPKSEPIARLGKYELIRRIAVGGMAEIFLARVQAAHGFEKLVVLKRILPQYAEDEEFVRMLLDEARLAATLHHPNIVQVYDMGVDEESGQSFFAMEYVRGQDLRKVIRSSIEKSSWLPLEYAINVVTSVAAGLHHAHDQVDHGGKPLQIVHRDVSPSNILVTYAGAVKLVDFGIAKATVAQSTTRHGTLKGKIPYMSPEQCRGEKLDRRSDIFSLGTVLWELTTGVRLWKSDNELATLSRIANEDAPPPSWKNKDYPKELEAIVMRALERDREKRYQTAQELQLDLEEFAREQKLRTSSAYLGRYMQEIFADEIAKEVKAAREEPDHSVQTLLTRDLDFLGSRALEMEGAKTTEFTPAELEAQLAAHDDPQATPSHGTSNPSVVYAVGSAQRTKRRVAIGAAAAGALVAGIAMWIASGDSGSKEQDAASTAPVPAQADTEVKAPPPEPTVASPTVEPSPTVGADTTGAQPAPTLPAEAALDPPDPSPTEASAPKTSKKKPVRSKKKRTGSRKKSSKGKKDWNRDSALLPP